jgi:hypothetical protein
MGENHTLALKTDGTVWAWGHNAYGQLGNGNNTHQNQPVQVMSDVTAIGTGRYHSYAIKNDGTVWAWGANWDGQLGDGTFDNKNVPTQTQKLSAITALATSDQDFTLALKNDGTVWAWGNNEYGSVGDGTFEDRNSPVQVGAPLTGVTKLATRAFHSLVLRTDGTVWGWSYNLYGALGDGTFVSSTGPVQTVAFSCAGITPDTGSYLGGTNVTITGTNFLSGATVTFDGLPATGVNVVNANEITAVTPAHAAGVVDVTVTNPDLQSDTMVNGYTYTDQPTVESVVPNSGPSAGGTAVTLTGINYLPGSTVTFDGVPATEVVVVNDTQITCVTPAHPLGAVDVTVTTTNGSGSLTDGFTYAAATDIPGEWANAGTPIDGTPTPDEPAQNQPYAITASDGDFIAAWIRQGLDGDDDIAVQKISRSNGTRLWPDDGSGSGGMAVTDLGDSEINQRFEWGSESPLVADNNGGAYLIWVGYPAEASENLMLQRIGSDGTLLYGNDPKNLSQSTENIEIADYSIIADGTGGVYVAWTEENTLTSASRVRMKRVDAAGTEYTVETTIFPLDTYTPRLVLDSANRAYIAYLYWDGQAEGLYLRRIETNGTVPVLGQDWFSAYQMPLVTGEEVRAFGLTIDSNDDIILAYVSYIWPGYTVSAQKIDHRGAATSWFTPGVGGTVLSDPSGWINTSGFQVVADGNDGAIVAWMQSDAADPPHLLPYLQKVDGSGNNLWGLNGVQGGGENRFIRAYSSLVADGVGGAIIAFFDETTSIGLQKISSAGSRLWPSGSPSLEGFTDFSNYTDGRDQIPVLAGDGQGGAAVFWVGTDLISGYNDIYGQYYRETTVPTISSVIPQFGPTTGGTPVTITGTNFNDPALVVWFGTSQCANTTVVNSTTITCETPAHPAGAVDVSVVGENGQGVLTEGYTYSDDILCFSDGINTFCGSQYIDELGCPIPSTTFVNGPDNFRFGSDAGGRNVLSSNDTAYSEALNGAYFEETESGVFADQTDTLTINSNTPFECPHEDAGVTLSVSATPFKNATNQDLVTYGADGLPGGTDANADYYAMFSLFTSGAATCTDPCVPAQGSVESGNAVKNGQNNFFAQPGPNNGTPAASFDSTAVLINNANQTNEVVLYDSSMGFLGDVTIPGLDFVLAIPANIQFTGQFTSTVTYTLS